MEVAGFYNLLKKHIEFGYGFEISSDAIKLAKQVPASENLHFIEANLPRIPENKYPAADCWIFNPPPKSWQKNHEFSFQKTILLKP